MIWKWPRASASKKNPTRPSSHRRALSGGASETLAQLPEHGVGSLPEGYVAGQQGQWGKHEDPFVEHQQRQPLGAGEGGASARADRG
jgi:hypothetical protein